MCMSANKQFVDAEVNTEEILAPTEEEEKVKKISVEVQ